MNRLFLILGLLLVLCPASRAMRSMSWENLMRVKAAAEQGNAEAQYLLGVQYQAGDGVDRDRREAVKWLRKSAEAGYAEAQSALGEYLAGLDPADELADPREAEKWLKAAAAQGNAEAKSRLEGLQAKAAPAVSPPVPELNGRLVPVDLAEEPAVTLHWSEELAGLRGDEALLVRGFLLEYGIHVNRDLNAAAEAYRAAAMHGDARGQLRLSAFYEEGRGVPKDASVAQGWRLLARGEGTAATWAAVTKGSIVQMANDEAAEAAKWSLVLSGLRGAEAFLARGFVLENGIQVARDLAAAADNYRLAAGRGNDCGKLLLSRLEATPRVEPKDESLLAAGPSAPSSVSASPVVAQKPGQK